LRGSVDIVMIHMHRFRERDSGILYGFSLSSQKLGKRVFRYIGASALHIFEIWHCF